MECLEKAVALARPVFSAFCGLVVRTNKILLIGLNLELFTCDVTISMLLCVVSVACILYKLNCNLKISLKFTISCTLELEM